MGELDLNCNGLLQAVLDTLPQHIAVINVEGIIIMVNASWQRFGHAQSSCSEVETGVGANYFEACRNATGSDRREARAALKGLRAVLNGTRPQFSLDYACETPTEVLWFSMTATPLSLPNVGAIIAHTDVSEQKKYAAMAYTDPLTDVANRRFFAELAAHILTTAKRKDHKVALIIVDLDSFKAINDRYGHEAGDELLMAFAKRLRTSFRANDLVARLGGDEFAVVFSALNESAICRSLERCLSRLNQPYTFGGRRLSVKASLGVARFPLHGADLDTLLRSADEALYWAKRRGGGVAYYG